MVWQPFHSFQYLRKMLTKATERRENGCLKIAAQPKASCIPITCPEQSFLKVREMKRSGPRGAYLVESRMDKVKARTDKFTEELVSSCAITNKSHFTICLLRDRGIKARAVR